MISSSADFGTVIASDDRQFTSRLSVNGTELDGDLNSWKITKGSCGGSQFDIGAVMSSTFTASIKNLTTNVKNEDIKVEIGLMVNGAYEYITLGYFTATEVKRTHYQTSITAYGHSVSKTGDILSMSTTQTLANIKNAISSATGVNVALPASVDGTRVIDKSLDDLTTYQVLQILASVVGGYVIDKADGSIAVMLYDDTSTLSVGTDRMVRLPDVEEDNFTITGIQCTVDETVYTSGTVNVEMTNEYVTSDLFSNELAPNIIGYSYRPASIDLSKGDPRLEGNDVLTVTDIDGTTYTVPCHSVTHTYDGGLATKVESIRATMIANLEGTSAPISTALKEQEKQIVNVSQIASNTNQYFWFTGTGTDTGAHITEVPQDEFTDPSDPNYHSGGNLLARSNGIAVRDGLKELAVMSKDGFDAKTYDANDNEVTIAHLGYGLGNTESGTANAPYYTLGIRKSGADVGNYSLASGKNIEASGSCSVALGSRINVNGTDYYLSATGINSVALNEGNTASGRASMAVGTCNSATGYASFAAGDECISNENMSFALGGHLATDNVHQTVIGRYNAPDTAIITIERKVFVIGNGTADSARSNALTVDWTGDIQMGLPNYQTSGSTDKALYDAIVALGWQNDVIV